jgi:hypothetical protein
LYIAAIDKPEIEKRLRLAFDTKQQMAADMMQSVHSRLVLIRTEMLSGEYLSVLCQRAQKANLRLVLVYGYIPLGTNPPC